MTPELKSAISVTIFATSILNLIMYFIISNVLDRTPNIIFILLVSIAISSGCGWWYYRHRIS